MSLDTNEWCTGSTNTATSSCDVRNASPARHKYQSYKALLRIAEPKYGVNIIHGTQTVRISNSKMQDRPKYRRLTVFLNQKAHIVSSNTIEVTYMGRVQPMVHLCTPQVAYLRHGYLLGGISFLWRIQFYIQLYQFCHEAASQSAYTNDKKRTNATQ